MQDTDPEPGVCVGSPCPWAVSNRQQVPGRAVGPSPGGIRPNSKRNGSGGFWEYPGGHLGLGEKKKGTRDNSLEGSPDIQGSSLAFWNCGPQSPPSRARE